MTTRTKRQLARSAELAALYHSLGFGPGTALSERQSIAREMSEQGVTLADIARMFGVTQEAVRHWVRGQRSVYLTEDEIDLVMRYREKMARLKQ